jgi:esterase/lipase
MNEAKVSNPKDFAVVSFHNSTDFNFTPEMGCMFDGRAINGEKALKGESGVLGIAAGETMILPYHIGHLLAKNLAKRVLNTSPAATVDVTGIPTGVAVWSDVKLEELKNSYLTEQYTEAKPVAQSETDKLMAKVEEYRKLTEQLLAKSTPVVSTTEKIVEPSKVFADKQEVIAELEKRNIVHDKRKSKVELEKLLA